MARCGLVTPIGTSSIFMTLPSVRSFLDLRLEAGPDQRALARRRARAWRPVPDSVVADSSEGEDADESGGSSHDNSFRASIVAGLVSPTLTEATGPQSTAVAAAQLAFPGVRRIPGLFREIRLPVAQPRVAVSLSYARRRAPVPATQTPSAEQLAAIDVPRRRSCSRSARLRASFLTAAP